MKKLLAAGGVLLLVVVAWVVAGRLGAQEKMPPVAPDTKIGLVDLTYVISYYHKYKTYKEELKAEAKPYEDHVRELQAQAAELQKESAEANVTQARREEIERTLIKLKADIDTTNVDAKNKLAKEAADEMILLYKEVQATSARYAKAHNLDLVLQYNEPLDTNDLYSPANIERKMGSGALVPLYYADGMEISKEILAILNESK